MAVKLTKRKGFNFFRSYYDVYNELETTQEKVDFIDALLNRQFLGVKPTDLKGMAKFAYISQTNSIDSQVKGYEDKTKTKLNPLEPTKTTPTQPPTDGGKTTPTVQVEEKEKVQDVTKYNEYTENQFLKRWKDARLHFDKKPTNISKLQSWELINFNNIKKTYSGEQIDMAIQGLFQQETFPKTRLRPSHFLELEHFETYLTCFTTKERLFEKKGYKKQNDRL